MKRTLALFTLLAGCATAPPEAEVAPQAGDFAFLEVAIKS